MEIFRMAQVAYQFLHLFGIAIFLVALVVVLTWPPVRGRGWLIAALILKLAAGGGYLLLGVAQLVGMFDGHGPMRLPVGLIQVGFLLLAVIGLTGDGLLLAALLRLTGALRAIHPASPASAPSPWQ